MKKRRSWSGQPTGKRSDRLGAQDAFCVFYPALKANLIRIGSKSH